MDLLDRMLGHDHWATTTVLDYCENLTDAQLDQQFDVGRQSLRETLTHMIYTIDLWTSLMTDRSKMSERNPHLSLAELRELHDRFHATYASFARRANDEGRLDETFNDHHNYPQSIGATIYQVMWHNAIHRSECRHILVRFGVEVRRDLDPQEWEHLTGRISS
jgi:uncharacterized damage-inducible protein DinB